MIKDNAISMVEIFTDGACRGNPGPGGWGVLLRYGEHEKHLYGAEELTTNNRMELTAVIKGLNALKKSCLVHVTTDSQYVHKGVTEWLAKWQQNGWKNKKKDAIKNLDLWQELIVAKEKHQVKWHWIKGHSGHRENEIADILANQAIDELLSKVET
jgi:ribonuclease HI